MGPFIIVCPLPEPHGPTHQEKLLSLPSPFGMKLSAVTVPCMSHIPAGVLCALPEYALARVRTHTGTHTLPIFLPMLTHLPPSHQMHTHTPLHTPSMYTPAYTHPHSKPTTPFTHCSLHITPLSTHLMMTLQRPSVPVPTTSLLWTLTVPCAAFASIPSLSGPHCFSLRGLPSLSGPP